MSEVQSTSKGINKQLERTDADRWLELQRICDGQQHDKETLKRAVLLWTKLGFFPIPLHALDSITMQCTCSRGAECRSKGKHPLSEAWQAKPFDLRGLLEAILVSPVHALPNIGLRMGTQGDGSQLLLIDDDGALHHLQKEYGPLPGTLTLRSGSGGRHLIFRVPPDAVLSNKVGISSNATPGTKYRVDLRTNGGQGAVGPSLHVSGGRYGVVTGMAPADLPASYLDLFRVKEQPTLEQKPLEAERGTERERLISRARAYIAKMPLSVEHQEGHNKLFAVARVLYWGFYPALDEQACDSIFWEYAQKGDPETEKQLLHKKSDALKGKYARGKPQGHLAAERTRGRPAAPLPTDDELRRMAKSAGIGLDDEVPNTSHAYIPVCESRPAFSTRCRPCTDAGNAERLHDLFGRLILYVEATSSWFVWDRTRFAPAKDVSIQALAKEVARSINAEAAATDDPTHKRALVSWAKKSEGAQHIMSMVKLVRDAVRVDPDKLDADPWLLNCANGTVDLRTGQRLEHDPSHLITKITRASYDPAVRSPLLEGHLEKCQPDPEMRAYLKRTMGYAATGVIREHTYEVHTGNGKDAEEGRNGKGMFLRTIQWVLGSYAGYPPTNLFVSRPNDSEQHPTGFMTLKGKRMAVVGETRRGMQFNVEVVKRLHGGDPINGRGMRQDFEEDFLPSHKSHMETNHLPRVGSNDAAIWERLRVNVWPVHLSKDERQEDLRERLRGEATGVLTWIVEGCLEWQRAGQKTNPPAAVVEATRAYKDGEDDLGAFLEERTARGDNPLEGKTLYQSYTAWCDATGKSPLSSSNLTKALKARGMTGKKSNGSWKWGNLQLVLLGYDYGNGVSVDEHDSDNDDHVELDDVDLHEDDEEDDDVELDEDDDYNPLEYV